MGLHRKYSVLPSLLLSVIVLGISGCQSPRSQQSFQPEVTIPALYTDHAIDPGQVVDQRPWWLDLNRPALNQLIDQALAANFDVRQAMARIQQAQSVNAQTRSGRWPQIDLSGDAGKEWQGGDPQRGEAYIGVMIQWELDAFDRIGAAARADSLEIQARIEDLAALRLTLSAEVANAYFGAVSVARRLELLNQQVRDDKKLLQLLQLRFNQGVGTKVEVLQQQNRVADSQSLIPGAEADLRLFENRLDVLLGQVPDTRHRVLLSETLAYDDTLPSVGVPAGLLLSRPDLRAAKAELVAADADIEAAIADRLPRITLSGAAGFQDQASYNGPISMIMAAFVQPLIDWGQRKAEVERNRAIYSERLAAFTQRYLLAIEAVENALYQENRQREFVKRLDQQRQILAETVQETEARYLQGIDDYLPVLNALEELRDIERDLIDEQLNLVRFRIALHRAVGGPLTAVQPGDDL